MADHPPEKHIRQAEKAAQQSDPHGLGKPSHQEQRAEADPAAMPTDARHETETAHTDE
jgi:hypothetical protein